MTNEQLAGALEQMAEVMAAEAADPFRAHAYRRAAHVVRTWPSPVGERYAKGGCAALIDLPGVGAGIARVIAELLETGHLAILDRRRHAGCERALASVPGIGAVLARRIHLRLGVHALEELEAAAHDGRLAHVPGFGTRRVRGVRETLAGRLRRHRPPPLLRPALPVAELLDVDREYRDKATRGLLLRIAPPRCNPERAAWLPVLRTQRGSHQYTALFSNTPRAHALGRTDDWVVLYADDGRSEREATVVTETQGPLANRRVVRGREDDCAAHYAVSGAAACDDAAESRVAS